MWLVKVNIIVTKVLLKHVTDSDSLNVINLFMTANSEKKTLSLRFPILFIIFCNEEQTYFSLRNTVK